TAQDSSTAAGAQRAPYAVCGSRSADALAHPTGGRPENEGSPRPPRLLPWPKTAGGAHPTFSRPQTHQPMKTPTTDQPAAAAPNKQWLAEHQERPRSNPIHAGAAGPFDAPTVVSPEDWLAARRELLREEKELTR